jgi:hypothetical protein
MNYYFFLLLIVLFSCNNSPKHEYEYKDLKTFQIDSTVLADGDLVEIFAMSGSGKTNDKDNVYYYQTLVKTRSRNDTIRILSPLFKLPTEDKITGREYFSPKEYNYNSKILEAKFERKDENLNILIQALNDLSNKDGEPVDLTAYFNGGMVKHEMVAVNKTLPIFNNTYKTIIGILAFTKDPR